MDLNAVKKEVYLNQEFYLKLEKVTKEDDNDELSEEEKEFNKRKKSTSEKYKIIKLV
jgi:hypothetical protein